VIVVNDGSTDGGKTEEIAKSYGDTIRYFVKENGGVASALNRGIQEMKGRYFSWLSHDDVYYPNKIETQIVLLKFLEEDVIIYADYDIIDAASRVTGSCKITAVPQELFRMSLMAEFPVNGCSTLIPRQCFDTVGLFSEELRTVQDYDMWLRLAVRYQYFKQDEIVMKSRVHEAQGSNASTVHISESNQLYIKALEVLCLEEVMNWYKVDNAALAYLMLARSLRTKSCLQASQKSFSLSLRYLTAENSKAKVQYTKKALPFLCCYLKSALWRRLGAH